MKALLPGILISLVSSPALAEVCDKVRPDWTPVHGRMSELEELYFLAISPVGLSLLGLVVAAVLFGKRWIPLLCVIALLGSAVLLAATRFGPGYDISKAAMQEGCIASPAMPMALVILAALGVGLLSRNRAADRWRAS